MWGRPAGRNAKSGWGGFRRVARSTRAWQDHRPPRVYVYECFVLVNRLVNLIFGFGKSVFWIYKIRGFVKILMFRVENNDFVNLISGFSKY